MQEKKSVKRGLIICFMVLLYLGGVFVYALPDVRTIRNEKDSKRVIENFDEQALESRERTETVRDDTEKFTADGVSEELHQKMQEYNRGIFEDGQLDLSDPWSASVKELDLSEYGIQDETIGVISVPAMGVELPVYFGADSAHMAKGAALMEGTSFPMSGENVNAVIAAHRGFKGIPMFRNIEQVSPGDTLTIRNYWEILTYRVTDIRVIMPEDVEGVYIREGKNMVTLVTCHPYTKHSRRYMVQAELTDDAAASDVSQGSGADVSDDLSGNTEAEYRRKQAVEEDGEALKEEKLLHRGGYVLLLFVGIIILWEIRKK